MDVMMQAKPKRVMDLTGHVYGKWTVMGYHGVIRYNGSRSQAHVWYCRCECGVEKTVHAVSLRSGTSRGCQNCNHEMHGMAQHPLYPSWLKMRSRCNNPNDADYVYYGKRGISVCERWDSFPVFVDDVGGARPPGRTLDRIDTNGNYEPSNVRWATYAEQVANRRKWGTAKS